MKTTCSVESTDHVVLKSGSGQTSTIVLAEGIIIKRLLQFIAVSSCKRDSFTGVHKKVLILDPKYVIHVDNTVAVAA